MSEWKIFDTHAHYDDEAFDEDREQLLTELPKLGVSPVVNMGSDLAGCRGTIALTERYDYIYGAIGVHPSDCAEMTEEDYLWLRDMCGREKIVAVGEIGLDYYWPEPGHDLQEKWFRRQLGLARETGLPVVIHSRDAAQATYDIHTVVLSGGVFMNRYLCEQLVPALAEVGFTVAMNKDLPPNDGCISFGQAVGAWHQNA